MWCLATYEEEEEHEGDGEQPVVGEALIITSGKLAVVRMVKEDSTESQSEPKYSDSSQSGGWQNLPKRANITVPNHSTPKPTSTC